MASKGNRKSTKSKQPKRQRYNMERRGHKRRLKRLKAHCERWPQDKQAASSIERVERRALGIDR